MILTLTRLALPMLALAAGACAQDEPRAPRTDTGNPAATPAAAQAPAGGGGYDFTRPDVSYALPDDLMEISGLAMLSDGRLAAVQDEDGVIFVINPESGAVEARYPFGDGGDYEGVEQVGDRLFVLRSNGNLIEIAGWDSGAPQVTNHKTDLKSKNDTEGLAYDAANERLLIACKEDPGEGVDGKKRAVYAFDLAAGRLVAEPVLLIDRNAVEGQVEGKGNFKPSGIAVHPQSGEIYVLSSVLKVIAVLGGDGEVQRVLNLPESAFEQPEGIAFSPAGDLYISSEGVDGPAMLYRFRAGSGS